MTSPELDNLVKIGQLKREPSRPDELDGLRRSGEARLADAERRTLAIESRFDLAYNAAAHASRNVTEYEGSLDIDERLLEDMIRAAKAVKKALDDAVEP